MYPCGQVIEDIFDLLDAHNNETKQNRIWRKLNYEYFRLCAETSWQALRTGPLEVDLSSSSYSSGMFLPSDMLGIDLVWDENNGVEFIRKDRAPARLDEWGYRYYTHYPARTDLFPTTDGDGEDLVLAQGATTFTSATLTAEGTSVDGEYVMFDDEPGIYKITDDDGPFTFEPRYNGVAKNNKLFRIRPWELTQKIVCIDEDEDELTDRTVEVYYWRMPVPLYRKQDIVMLPTPEILKLRVLRSLPEAKGVRPVTQNEISDAMDEALQMNPRFDRIASPMTVQGTRFEINSNIFGTR